MQLLHTHHYQDAQVLFWFLQPALGLEDWQVIR
jgi:hypothetical protein